MLRIASDHNPCWIMAEPITLHIGEGAVSEALLTDARSRQVLFPHGGLRAPRSHLKPVSPLSTSSRGGNKNEMLPSTPAGAGISSVCCRKPATMGST